MSVRRNHKIINGIELKWCPGCQEYKKLNQFSCDKANPDGLRGQCRQCKAKGDKKYRSRNQGKILQRKREDYKQNKAHYLKRSRRWQIDNPERRKKIVKKWAEENPEKCQEARKKWAIQNPDKARQSRLGYCERNAKEIAKRRRQNDKKRRNTLRGNLNSRMSCAIRRALRNRKMGKHWEDLVGYTTEDLIKHLKKTLPCGYLWDDLSKLHVDHKFPISAFNFKSPEDIDFKKCWALSNLQLLPSQENLRKSNRLNKPFQPSLAIGG